MSCSGFGKSNSLSAFQKTADKSTTKIETLYQFEIARMDLIYDRLSVALGRQSKQSIEVLQDVSLLTKSLDDAKAENEALQIRLTTVEALSPPHVRYY